MNPVINVSIADDHTIFRNGLAASLEPYDHIRIISRAESGEQLIEQIEQQKPDVALIDIKMRGMDGIETTRIIKSKHPDIKILGLSVFENHNYITNMFKAGANGYLLKDATPQQITEAIDTVMRSEYYFNDMVSHKLLKSLLDVNHPSTENTFMNVELTTAEVDIIKLIGAEMTNAEIALKLNLGSKTIENYRNKLLTKTGAKNTVGLVIYGIRRGYIVI